MNRDLGIPGGPGKGDADRTSDREAFEKNLAEIPFNPQDKTGFEKTGHGRFKKTYKEKPPETRPEGEPVEPSSTPSLLMRSIRSRLAGTGPNED